VDLDLTAVSDRNQRAFTSPVSRRTSSPSGDREEEHCEQFGQTGLDISDIDFL
jgi:hypothetical protein